MAKLNRICGVCRHRYSYCPSCAADANKPTWLTIFCCDNCRKLYNVINDYRYKLLSKEDAFCKLNSLDLSYANELTKSFKETFDEILGIKHDIEKEVVVPIKVTESEIVEQEVKTVNEEIIETEVEVKEVTEKENHKRLYKKNYNKKTNVKVMNSESD